MASHTLDQQPSERLFTEIADLRRQLSEMRTLQLQGATAVNLQVSTTYGTSHELPPNTYGLWNFLFSNPDNRRLFGTFEFTMWEGTAAAGNEIGRGTTRDGNFRWSYWRDMQASDGNNLRDYVWVVNVGPDTKIVHVIGRWRYLVSGGTGSV